MPTRYLDDATPIVQFDPQLEVSPFALFRRVKDGDPPLLVDVRPAPGRLSSTLASEVIGKRVADRLPVAYGVASGVIVLLGLLAFRLARGA